MNSLDQTSSRLTRGQLAISAAAFVAGVLCFFPWFKIQFTGELAAMLDSMVAGDPARPKMSATAFEFKEGILAFVTSVIAFGALPVAALGIIRLKMGQAALIALIASSLAALCTLVFIVRSSSPTVTGVGVTGGQTLWSYASLGAAACAALLAYRQCRKAQRT